MRQRPAVTASGPLTRGDAHRLGITTYELTASPRFRRVFHGVYVPSGLPDTTELRARAALRVGPAGAVISRHTAAELWDAVVPRHPAIHLTTNRTGRWDGPAGIVVHNAAGFSTTNHLGLPMTSPAQTFVDLAADLDLVDLVVVADGLIRRERCRPEDLRRAVDVRPRKIRALAGRAVELSHRGVDSAPETRTRLLITLAGLPEPRVGVVVRRPDGSRIHRLDLAWEELMLAIEYDGRQHAENDVQWRHDITRREELDGLGWRTMVLRSADLWQTPGATLDRLMQARLQRGATATRLRPEWRRYFPGHLPARG